MPALAYAHIHKVAGEPARLERFPRVRVAQIVADHLGHGWSAEEIVRQYPHLAPAEIYGALTYYFDHPAEIDAELSEEVASLEQTEKRPPSALRLRLLTARAQPAE